MSDQRIDQLDALRGVAVLGILIMNIKGFAMVGAAYINPMALGEPSLAQWSLFVFERLFVDYKFLGLFSLLFGVTLALIFDGSASTHGSALAYQYRRLAVLGVIGAIHAICLWFGDILFSYAVCGFAVVLLARLPLPLVILLGTASFCVPMYAIFSSQMSLNGAPAEVIESMSSSFWTPTPDVVAQEISAYTGTLSEQFTARLESLEFMIFYLLPRENFWKSSGFMLTGIALYRSGFFGGLWPRARYLRWGVTLTLLGVVITFSGMLNDMLNDFDLRISLEQGRGILYLGSIPTALGYASLFYYLTTSASWGGYSRLAAVGRLALTNYIMQTLLCTALFYGWGFGFFGRFSSVQLLIVVVSVWLLQLVLSPWWLSRFGSGPLERLWRVLSGRPKSSASPVNA